MSTLSKELLEKSINELKNSIRGVGGSPDYEDGYVEALGHVLDIVLSGRLSAPQVVEGEG